jgi:REP element-mobilizing transposase RayT
LDVTVKKGGGTSGFQGGEADTGFQPVDPWESPEVGVSKRHLPHVQIPQATYFVTFRCCAQRTLPPAARDIVMLAIRHWDRRRIELDVAVVMPEHVHAIFRILDDSELSTILHSVKSFSANQVNLLLRKTGRLWLDESFDHIIRHEQEWQEKISYVRDNPVKRGLASCSEEYPWLWPKK